MTSTTSTAGATSPPDNRNGRSALRSRLRFAGHFVEMVVAMLAAMLWRRSDYYHHHWASGSGKP